MTMTTEEKKQCENCAPKPRTSISVTDIYHPHCAHCGRCLDGRCVQVKHDGTVLTPPETVSDIREKIEKTIGSHVQITNGVIHFERMTEDILSIVREAVSEAPADMEQWTHTHTPRASIIERSGCRACIQEQTAKDYQDAIIKLLS